LRYLGSTVVAGGNWTLSGLSLNAGDEVIANVRDNDNNNTSPFSAQVSVALPIELLSFTAKSINNQYVLTEWKTASEINTDHFTIERSQDAMNYEIVGTVPAAGNSYTPLTYSLSDEDPYLGTSYYRLKQVDIDGNYEYFGPVAVKLKTDWYGMKLVNIYPNPANDKLTYEVESWQDMKIEIKILDLLGREIMTIKKSVKKGLNIFDIDVSHLSKALYLFTLTTPGDKYHSEREFMTD